MWVFIIMVENWQYFAKLKNLWECVSKEPFFFGHLGIHYASIN